MESAKMKMRCVRYILRRKKEGSLTVEASLLFPVLVLLLMFFLQQTIDAYQGINRTAEQIQSEDAVDTTNIFLHYVWGKELLEK